MPPAQDTADFLTVADRRLHYRWHGEGRSGTPLVFLHEGLGSVELWRDFPAAVADETGHPALVFSRHGNGWSTPLSEPRTVEYMHDEARHVLPVIIEEEVGRPPFLVGHSDGASIALIYAGSGAPVAGLVLIAPHVFVEDATVASIAAIEEEFATSDLAERMAGYHEDPAATFRGWADVWLSRSFRSWNIEEYLPAIDAPILLIQGSEDEYGTMRQLDAIAAGVAGSVDRLMVDEARHSPHLSHPEPVLAAVERFIDDAG
jgi:pimeloyl-ACP methyl ester carboxylesterase